jgi:hypothetical protein
MPPYPPAHTCAHVHHTRRDISTQAFVSSSLSLFLAHLPSHHLHLGESSDYFSPTSTQSFHTSLLQYLQFRVVVCARCRLGGVRLPKCSNGGSYRAALGKLGRSQAGSVGNRALRECPHVVGTPPAHDNARAAVAVVVDDAASARVRRRRVKLESGPTVPCRTVPRPPPHNCQCPRTNRLGDREDIGTAVYYSSGRFGSGGWRNPWSRSNHLSLGSAS